MASTPPIIKTAVRAGIDYALLNGFNSLILANATITASGGSALYYVGGARQIDLLVDVTGTVSGTTPTLKFSIDIEVVDDTNLSTTLEVNDVGTITTYNGTSLSAAGTDSITIVGSASASGSSNTSIIGDYIKVAWTVTGTSPSFGGVYARIIVKK